MKNITLSAEEGLIERARAVARERKSTLNAEFRKWLESYAGREQESFDYAALKKRLGYVRIGKHHFTRDEMNERR